MIDLANETPLTLKEAAARLPGRPHLGTLHRWIAKGVRGVHLEAGLLGGKRITSLEAVQRFLDALSGTAPEGARPAPRLRRGHREAARRLNAEGIQ
jgi:hypothetical protein